MLWKEILKMPLPSKKLKKEAYISLHATSGHKGIIIGKVGENHSTRPWVKRDKWPRDENKRTFFLDEVLPHCFGLKNRKHKWERNRGNLYKKRNQIQSPVAFLTGVYRKHTKKDISKNDKCKFFCAIKAMWLTRFNPWKSLVTK